MKTMDKKFLGRSEIPTVVIRQLAVGENLSEPAEIPQRERRHDVMVKSGEEFQYFHVEIL